MPTFSRPYPTVSHHAHLLPSRSALATTTMIARSMTTSTVGPANPATEPNGPPPGKEQHDELGQADREQAAEGEHAGLAARARSESRFHAEQPLPDEEPDADRDRVGDVGQRALEQNATVT
jgi:hypothetical protein